VYTKTTVTKCYKSKLKKYLENLKDKIKKKLL